MAYILIVEDDTDVSDVLAGWLGRSGHRIHCVGNGLAGLSSALNDEQPDLIVADYKMPEMDGKEMISLLSVTLPNCPVLVLTGYMEATLKAHLELEPNVVSVIEKPTDLHELVGLVQRTLDQRNVGEPLA